MLSETGSIVSEWLLTNRRPQETESTLDRCGLASSKEGDRLEAAVALVLSSRFGTTVEIQQGATMNTPNINLGSGVLNKGRGDRTGMKKSAEFDLVVRRYDHLLLVSCGARTDPASRRVKFLEVKSHAERLGGSEARTMTVVWDPSMTPPDDFDTRRLLARQTRMAVGIPDRMAGEKSVVNTGQREIRPNDEQPTTPPLSSRTRSSGNTRSSRSGFSSATMRLTIICTPLRRGGRSSVVPRLTSKIPTFTPLTSIDSAADRVISIRHGGEVGSMVSTPDSVTMSTGCGVRLITLVSGTDPKYHRGFVRQSRSGHE